LREKINIPGSMIEGFFKPELDRIMNDLRVADDNIRSILTGQKIGKADVNFTAGKSIKDLLKSARSNFNRREYMAGVADLGEFHKRMFDVTQYIKKLDLSINRIHHDFLFRNLNEEQKNKIRGLQDYMSKSSELQNEAYFIKEAGIMDFFYNIGTKRGRALAIWEKKYPKVAKELRDGGSALINTADGVLSNTLSLLKAMATARAVRRVDDYMEAAKKIQNEYAKFDGGDKGFRAYYTKVIEPYFKRQDEFEKEEAAKLAPPAATIPTGTRPDTDADTTPNTATPPTSTPTSGTPGPLSPQPVGTIPPMGSGPVGGPAYSWQHVPPTSEEAGTTEKKPTVTAAHQSFYESLESLSKEDPSILAGYISKYASSIQGADPETALELFAIVRKIKG
jgi:hypothetical protein